MSTKARKAAVDIGNDAVKSYFGELTSDQGLYIPNIIAEEAEDRKTIQIEKNLLDGIHVQIVSGALSEGKGIYVVGNLATRYENSDELTPDNKKSENDQSLILLLTTLAIDAARHIKESKGIVEASYNLSTGLPLGESKLGKRPEFRDKLINAQHEVKFLQTPEIGGKTVRIRFEDVLVNTEGAAALFDIITSDDGSVRNEELAEQTGLITDIGGLSTDSAIIMPGMDIDNNNSVGIREGVSPYLDAIIDRVQRELDYSFRNRQELVEVLTDERVDRRNHVFINGNRTSIQTIVDEELIRLAREEYKHIRNLWTKVSSIQYAFLIGGGSLLLKPYIEELNKKQKGYPLRFVDSRDSVWMIARAYFKLLNFHMSQQGSSQEVAATE
ncbi:hypothetical protein [Alicyclobacillus fodiniaquatilis]|uniref:Plasmid segregation protein ParM n=1 Tax=Alicyclobacillus fodiniaquatilis TaxID=1661150 RepID=A0ABW4JEP8_9BACL